MEFDKEKSKVLHMSRINVFFTVTGNQRLKKSSAVAWARWVDIKFSRN